MLTEKSGAQMVLAMKVGLLSALIHPRLFFLTADSLLPSAGMYKMAGCRRKTLPTFSAKEPFLSFQGSSTSQAMWYVYALCRCESL